MKRPYLKSIDLVAAIESLAVAPPRISHPLGSGNHPVYAAPHPLQDANRLGGSGEPPLPRQGGSGEWSEPGGRDIDGQAGG